MGPRRVAILIPQRGSVVRGGESSALGLARHLHGGYNVTVFGSRPVNDVPWRQVAYRDPVVWTIALAASLPGVLHRVLRRVHLDPDEWRKLCFCIRALAPVRCHRPDILIVRSVGFWGSLFGRLLRARTGIPFISITGGWKTSELEQARLRPDAHVAVNPEVADHLRQRLPEVRVAFLPNGLDVAAFARDVPPADLKIQRPVYLTAGAILDFKRYHLAIEAVAALGRGSLAILGSGDPTLSGELQRLGSEVLGPDRFMMSSVPYDRMAAYYRACDVFTLPSLNESFGMAYIEAMAHNKPVVGPSDPSRRAIIGDGGIVCDPENTAEYAAALDRAVSDDFADRPLRQALKFDWAVLGPSYGDLIEEVLAAAPSDGSRTGDGAGR